MQDLAFIDQPLSTKRLRSKKNKDADVKSKSTLSGLSRTSSLLSEEEEEKRRRKNKE